MERFRHLITLSRGSLPLARAVKILGFADEDALAIFLAETRLGGITIDWDVGTVTFDGEDLSAEIDGLLQKFASWEREGTGKTRSPPPTPLPLQEGDGVTLAERKVKKDFGKTRGDVLKKTLAENPDDLAALDSLAKILQATSDRSEAAGTYRDILGRNPGKIDVLLKLGDLLGRAGDLAGAEEAFRMVKAINPRFSITTALFELGAELHNDLHDLPAAADAYERATKHDPVDYNGYPLIPLIWFDLGQVERGRERYEPALIAYWQAVSTPGVKYFEQKAWQALHLVLVALKEDGMALTCLERANSLGSQQFIEMDIEELRARGVRPVALEKIAARVGQKGNATEELEREIAKLRDELDL